MAHTATEETCAHSQPVSCGEHIRRQAAALDAGGCKVRVKERQSQQVRPCLNVGAVAPHAAVACRISGASDLSDVKTSSEHASPRPAASASVLNVDPGQRLQ